MLIFALALTALAADTLDSEAYPHVLADNGAGPRLHLHVGGDLGPYTLLTANAHANFVLPGVVSVAADLGLGIATKPARFNPWTAVHAGFPLQIKRRAKGRYVFSRQSRGNTTTERYFRTHLPIYHTLIPELGVLNATWDFSPDMRATSVTLGARYRVSWSALARFADEGGTWTPNLEHSWYISAHVLLTSSGPNAPGNTGNPLIKGFVTTVAAPVFNDRDGGGNMVMGVGLNGPAASLRIGYEWTGRLL